MMTFVSVALIFFLIIDPMGNVAIFHRLLDSYNPKQRAWIVLREMLIALLAVFCFYILGDWLLTQLNISPTAVRLSSGLILFIAAVKILFPSMGEFRSVYKPHGEPFVIPLAIPLVAGPSLLATVMLFANIQSIDLYIFPAFLIAWTLSLIIFLFAPSLHRFLGDNGLVALERVMGMVLVLLAIQRFLEGVQMFLATQPT